MRYCILNGKFVSDLVQPLKILREIMDRLGIVYGKMENPQSLSYHLISHITGNSNFSKDADLSAEYDEFFIEKVNRYVTVMTSQCQAHIR